MWSYKNSIMAYSIQTCIPSFRRIHPLKTTHTYNVATCLLNMKQWDFILLSLWWSSGKCVIFTLKKEPKRTFFILNFRQKESLFSNFYQSFPLTYTNTCTKFEKNPSTFAIYRASTTDSVVKHRTKPQDLRTFVCKIITNICTKNLFITITIKNCVLPSIAFSRYRNVQYYMLLFNKTRQYIENSVHLVIVNNQLSRE